MKKILVTGANGQLGNEMRLLAEEHKNFEYFFTDVAELDICDEQAVIDFVSTHQIDVIVNCAAYTAVDKAEDNVELCDKLNHVAPGYLAKAAQSRNGWLVQVSTDYVFDGTAHIPYKEEDAPCPNSVYGSTKLAGEQEALKQCPNTMVIRTAWLYSTFGNNFVKTMIRLGQEKETLGVIFDQIGTPTYARDLAQAIFVALEKGIVPGILANLVDATILTTDGFAIFKDKPMQALFKRIAAAQGMILLTDSDAAGFKIRHYITGLVGPQNVLQAYIPAVPGKEPRKPEPGKEGLLGVEGVDDALILQGLHTALAAAPLQAQQQNTDPITYTDLYEWGLSGSANASERRRTFLRILGLPPRLSKKEIIQVLNTLYTRDALQAQLEAMK